MELAFSNRLTSLLSALSNPVLAPMDFTILSKGLLWPVGHMSLWNEKNVDTGPSRGSCLLNCPH